MTLERPYILEISKKFKPKPKSCFKISQLAIKRRSHAELERH